MACLLGIKRNDRLSGVINNDEHASAKHLAQAFQKMRNLSLQDGTPGPGSAQLSSDVTRVKHIPYNLLSAVCGRAWRVTSRGVLMRGPSNAVSFDTRKCHEVSVMSAPFGSRLRPRRTLRRIGSGALQEVGNQPERAGAFQERLGFQQTGKTLAKRRSVTK